MLTPVGTASAFLMFRLPSGVGPHNTGAARKERDPTDQRGQGSDPSQDRGGDGPLDAPSPPSLEGGDSQDIQLIPLPPAGAGPGATPPLPLTCFGLPIPQGKGLPVKT